MILRGRPSRTSLSFATFIAFLSSTALTFLFNTTSRGCSSLAAIIALASYGRSAFGVEAAVAARFVPASELFNDGFIMEDDLDVGPLYQPKARGKNDLGEDPPYKPKTKGKPRGKNVKHVSEGKNSKRASRRKIARRTSGKCVNKPKAPSGLDITIDNIDPFFYQDDSDDLTSRTDISSDFVDSDVSKQDDDVTWGGLFIPSEEYDENIQKFATHAMQSLAQKVWTEMMPSVRTRSRASSMQSTLSSLHSSEADTDDEVFEENHYFGPEMWQVESSPYVLPSNFELEDRLMNKVAICDKTDRSPNRFDANSIRIISGAHGRGKDKPTKSFIIKASKAGAAAKLPRRKLRGNLLSDPNVPLFQEPPVDSEQNEMNPLMTGEPERGVYPVTSVEEDVAASEVYFHPSFASYGVSGGPSYCTSPAPPVTSIEDGPKTEDQHQTSDSIALPPVDTVKPEPSPSVPATPAPTSVIPQSIYNPFESVDKHITKTSLYVVFGFCVTCCLGLFGLLAYSMAAAGTGVAIAMGTSKAANVAMGSTTSLSSMEEGSIDLHSDTLGRQPSLTSVRIQETTPSSASEWQNIDML